MNTKADGPTEHVDRRVRKTRKALSDAFVALVLEHGYDAVTVEDITATADVARATFYAHYVDKEQLLTSLFAQIIEELSDRLTAAVSGAPAAIRTHLVRDLYEHAASLRHLYLVCFRGAGNGKARAAYVDIIATTAEAVYVERLRATSQKPRVPLPTMARAFAGAHTALLETWLENGCTDPIDDTARVQIKLMTNGFAWALAMTPDELDAAFPTV